MTEIIAGIIAAVLGMLWRGIRAGAVESAETKKLAETSQGEIRKLREEAQAAQIRFEGVISHLKEETDKHRSTALDLYGKVEKLEADLAGTQAQLARVQSEYDKEKTAREKAEQEAKLAREAEKTSQATVTTLKADLTTAQTTISDLQKRVGELEGTINFMRGRDSAFIDFIKTLNITATAPPLPETKDILAKDKSDVEQDKSQ